MPLSERQLESVVCSDARVNVWEGAIRSGKTLASLLRWLLFVASAPEGGALVVVARTRDSAARNVFGPLQDRSLFGPMAYQTSYTAGAPQAVVLGRPVYVIGASDAKAEKVIRGLTVAGAYVDEATVIPEGFFTQLLGRMSVPGAQLFATTNPDNPAHWLKRRYLDRAPQLGWRVFRFLLSDNPSLTADYVNAITNEFTGLWYRRFILGEWVAAEGAIYSMWDPDRHLIPWAALPPMRRYLAVGVDYGTTNASAALTLGLSDERAPGGAPLSRLYLLDEFRYDPQHTQVRLTDAQLSARFREWMRAPHHPHPSALRPEWVAVDPAAASFKVQLYQDGVRNIVDAENDVAFGIRTVASLFGTGRLLVSDRCRSFVDEVTGYSWDPVATEKGKDEPLKVADHTLDAARYAVATTEGLWRPHLTMTDPMKGAA